MNSIKNIRPLLSREEKNTYPASFVFIDCKQFFRTCAAIDQTTKPVLTLKVWVRLLTHIEYNTGRLLFEQVRLAEEIGTQASNISTVLTILCSLNALYRKRRGVYYFNPLIAWKGDKESREQAISTMEVTLFKKQFPVNP